MNINQEIEKEEMKVQTLVKDWHSQKLVSFIDDLIKQDRAEQLILSGVSHCYTKEEVIKAYDDGFNDGNQRDLEPTR